MKEVLKNQKGISIITLIIIVVIVIGAIVIFANNQGKTNVEIEWGYMPSTEYYELRVAVAQSELYGAGKGTLSQTSFNTLGRDVKKAGGKWFKNNNVNFKASTSDLEGIEITTLSDGEHTATFKFKTDSNYVSYSYTNDDHKGYKITIK